MPTKFNDYVVASSRKYGLEKYVTYSKLNASNLGLSTTMNKSSEPNTYYEAVKNLNYIEAMNKEIEALSRDNTWTICKIERYKAKLVAKGFSQRKRFNYLETFSHVVKRFTMRCMLNVAICNNWDLLQLDIINAFW
ncbi:ribonuclease H-like domain-containing protein [Tanacetum coccineum]